MARRYIDRDTLVAEIEKFMYEANQEADIASTGECFDEKVADAKYQLCKQIRDSIDSLEVKDPYEQCVQYDSIKAGIQAHAETYSFNIQSELFNQLTKEQQALWRKEIEQAVISGGDAGVTLARDQRYKENLEVKEVGEPSNDLEEEIELVKGDYEQVDVAWNNDFDFIARHFYELGLKEQLKNK